MTTQLIVAAVLAASGLRSADRQTPGAPTVAPGASIIVTAEGQSIRGRLTQLTADWLEVRVESASRRIPLASVARIHQLGDPLFNGSAIGGLIGAGVALGFMAQTCSNTNCARTSDNLDPRLTLLGALIGSGIGAVVDRAIEHRRTIYTAGDPLPVLRAPSVESRRALAPHAIAFGRFGWARLTDDEGLLGDGRALGLGIIVPLTHRLAIQASYDSSDHRRDFEPVGGPVPGGYFAGTEQILAAKALFFFRGERTVRPYAGVGIGLMKSERESQQRTRAAGMGFAVGLVANVAPKLAVVGDLTLDLHGQQILGSTRATIGAGWRF